MSSRPSRPDTLFFQCTDVAVGKARWWGYTTLAGALPVRHLGMMTQPMEAAWDEDGAISVNYTRLSTLDDIKEYLECGIPQCGPLTLLAGTQLWSQLDP